jgi:ABC-type phosphate transport system substrate-binding protein
MKTFMKTIVAASLLTLSGITFADVVVIVNPKSGVTSLTQDEISRIFLGKTKSFPDGAPAVSVNQNEGSAVRDKFNQVVCNKTSSQYKAYWSQLIFTGKGRPPRNGGGNAAVKSLVAANPNMISYVDASVVDATVKVVYTLP